MCEIRFERSATQAGPERREVKFAVRALTSVTQRLVSNSDQR